MFAKNLRCTRKTSDDGENVCYLERKEGIELKEGTVSDMDGIVHMQ